jgi:hypothetical protein
MPRPTERITENAQGMPEGGPDRREALLHLGSRVAVDQALSRLIRRDQTAQMRMGRSQSVDGHSGAIRYVSGFRWPLLSCFLERCRHADAACRREDLLENRRELMEA